MEELENKLKTLEKHLLAQVTVYDYLLKRAQEHPEDYVECTKPIDRRGAIIEQSSRGLSDSGLILCHLHTLFPTIWSPYNKGQHVFSFMKKA